METFLTEALKTMQPLLVAALVALAAKVFQRLHLSVSAERDAQLQWVAQQAVQYAEEKAANYLKSTGVVPRAEQKLNDALAVVVSKLPHVDELEAQQAIQAALPQVGLGAAAGARALGKAMLTPESPK
jgi:hypothetical protein